MRAVPRRGRWGKIAGFALHRSLPAWPNRSPPRTRDRNPHPRPATAGPRAVLDREDLRQGPVARKPRRAAVVPDDRSAADRDRPAHAGRADRAGRLRMRADDHRHRARGRQDRVPGRGVAGGRVRDPRRCRRTSCSRCSRCTARRCCFRMRARPSPMRRCAPAFRPCISRRSISRRCTSSSSRRRPPKPRRSPTDRPRSTRRLRFALRALAARYWRSSLPRRCVPLRIIARPAIPRPCSMTRRRRARSRCTSTAAMSRSRCSSASRAGPRFAMPPARSAGCSRRRSPTSGWSSCAHPAPTCGRAPMTRRRSSFAPTATSSSSSPSPPHRRRRRRRRAGSGCAIATDRPGYVRLTQVFGF